MSAQINKKTGLLLVQLASEKYTSELNSMYNQLRNGILSAYPNELKQIKNNKEYKILNYLLDSSTFHAFSEECRTIIWNKSQSIEDNNEYRKIFGIESKKKRQAQAEKEIRMFNLLVVNNTPINRLITGNPIIDSAPYEIGIGGQIIIKLDRNACIALKEFNTINRTPTRSNVKAFITRLKNGTYSPYVEPFKIIADGIHKGSLADGQHRLDAFIELNMDGYLHIIVTVVPENDVTKLDSGKNRNDSEKATIEIRMNKDLSHIPNDEINNAIKYRRQLYEMLFILSNAKTSYYPVKTSLETSEHRHIYIHDYWNKIRSEMIDICETAPSRKLNKNITYAFISLLEFAVDTPNKINIINKFQNYISSSLYKKLPSYILDKFNIIDNKSNIDDYLVLYIDIWNYICIKESKGMIPANSNIEASDFNPNIIAFVNVMEVVKILQIDNRVNKAYNNNITDKYKRQPKVNRKLDDMDILSML